jgi:hypothetical protein
VTGLTPLTSELYSKRLELLKEAIWNRGLECLSTGLMLALSPRRTRWGCSTHLGIQRLLGLQLRRLEVRGPQSLGEAFATLRERLRALVVVRSDTVISTSHPKGIGQASEVLDSELEPAVGLEPTTC